MKHRVFKTALTVTPGENATDPAAYVASRDALTPASAGGLLASALVHASPGDSVTLTVKVEEAE